MGPLLHESRSPAWRTLLGTRVEARLSQLARAVVCETPKQFFLVCGLGDTAVICASFSGDNSKTQDAGGLSAQGTEKGAISAPPSREVAAAGEMEARWTRSTKRCCILPTGECTSLSVSSRVLAGDLDTADDLIGEDR